MYIIPKPCSPFADVCLLAAVSLCLNSVQEQHTATSATQRTMARHLRLRGCQRPVPSKVQPRLRRQSICGVHNFRLEQQCYWHLRAADFTM
jgi:hypothetical protein